MLKSFSIFLFFYKKISSSHEFLIFNYLFKKRRAAKERCTDTRSYKKSFSSYLMHNKWQTLYGNKKIEFLSSSLLFKTMCCMKACILMSF